MVCSIRHSIPTYLRELSQQVYPNKIYHQKTKIKMKKVLLLASAIICIVLCSAQNTWAKCETIISVPGSVCVGQKVSLSINVDPCDCIKYSDVEWIITDPASS